MRKIILGLLAALLFIGIGTGVAVSAHSAHAATVTPLPGQPAITDYQAPSGAGSNVVPFEHQGALIIAAQDTASSQNVQNAAAAGATVLDYLDPMIIQSNAGPYAAMLWDASSCGPAVPQWGTFNSGSAPLADFRTVADGGNGVEQAKLKCVLEAMVTASPWIGGFFADDLGSKSWYPGVAWSSLTAAQQQDWYDGAVALAATFHQVAAEHNMMLMVNGTWEAGTVASSGGGYPIVAANGISYADGGYIEHHAASELPFWTAYASGQWGTASGDVSGGKPVMYVQAPDAATMADYNAAGVFAYLSDQEDYSQPATVWGPFHATGLPSGSVSPAPAPAPTPTTPIPTPTTPTPIPTPTGPVLSAGTADSGASWASSVTPGTWKVTLSGPGKLNGSVQTVSVPQVLYPDASLTRDHTYTVTVQQLVNGVASGKAGKVTFIAG